MPKNCSSNLQVGNGMKITIEDLPTIIIFTKISSNKWIFEQNGAVIDENATDDEVRRMLKQITKRNA